MAKGMNLFTLWSVTCNRISHFAGFLSVWLRGTVLTRVFSEGTPRATADSFEDGLKYPKQIKRESPPIRAFEGAISKGKPYDGITTIKEMGRSVHEIPRQDALTQESRKTPEVVPGARPLVEGSISQVAAPAGAPGPCRDAGLWAVSMAAVCVLSLVFQGWEGGGRGQRWAWHGRPRCSLPAGHTHQV